MKSQWNGSLAAKTSYPRELLHAIGDCLPQRGLSLQSDDRRVRWTPRLVVTAAVLSAWAVASTCQEAFGMAREAVVKMYPTPTARDHKDGKGTEWSLENSKQHLGREIHHIEGIGGSLNPTWVEWLMGYPEGWTDLKG